MKNFESHKYSKDAKINKKESNSAIYPCEELIDDILKKKISVHSLDSNALCHMRKEWDRVSKPIGSFGEFEGIYSKIAVIQKKDEADLNHMRMVVFCGDHGIVREGVSQTGQEVTRLCAINIGKRLTTAGVMAKSLGIDVVSVDVGINYPQEVPFTRNCRVKNGTNSFLSEPAMSLDEFKKALLTGIKMAFESKQEGYSCLLVGEMGIGNTTSAAVMTGYLLNLDADTVTGRGAGLDDTSFAKKKAVVTKALSMYEELSVVDICCYFGGLELAAMTGFIMGAALYEIPVILDGMLSMTSALVAERLLKNTGEYLIPSHMSKEPVTVKLAGELGVEPVLYGKMAVGEGAGAVMLVPNLRMTHVVFTEALKFGDSGVDQYENYTEEK